MIIQLIKSSVDGAPLSKRKGQFNWFWYPSQILKLHGFAWHLCENINYWSSNKARIEPVISNCIAKSTYNFEFNEFKEKGNGEFKSILYAMCGHDWFYGAAKRYSAIN